MGTASSIFTHTQSFSQQGNWIQFEPIQIHWINVNDSFNPRNELVIKTNDHVVWAFTKGSFPQWRIIEVFKHGSRYLPIKGGTNFVLDEENNEFETVFNFPIRQTFAVIPNAIEFHLNMTIPYLIRIVVTTRNPIKCAITDSGFGFPYLIGQIGLPVVFTWKNLIFPISIARGEFDIESHVFKTLFHYESEVGRSGQISFTPDRSGVVIFAVIRNGIEVVDICSIRNHTQTLSHLVEVEDGGITPLVSEIISGTPVLFHLSNTDIAFSDELDSRIIPPYFYRMFSEQNINHFTTRNKSGSCSCVVNVLPASKRHHIRYSSQEFDLDQLKCKVGDIICFHSISDFNPPNFTVVSTRNRESNEQNIFVLSSRLIEKYFASGYVEYRVMDTGVHVFTTEKTFVAIASDAIKTHNIMVTNRGFIPSSSKVTKGDIVQWYWSGESTVQNIVQVTFDHDRIANNLNPFHSGLASSNSGFHHRFDTLGNFYFMSEGHSHPVRGEIDVWPASKVHTIICNPSIVLKPAHSQVSVGDWIVWISPSNLTIEIMGEDVWEDLVVLGPHCCALNVPVKGLIKLVLRMRFVELKDKPVVAVPFYVISDSILAPEIIHLPFFQPKSERHLKPGDFVVLSSNCDSQIQPFLNCVSKTYIEPKIIPIVLHMEPYGRTMVTFWKEGDYQLEFRNLLFAIIISKHTSICPAPSIPVVERSEVSFGHSLTIGTGHNVIYTTDGSFPTFKSPSTQLLTKNTLKFPNEDVVIVRAMKIKHGCVNSRVCTSSPSHPTNTSSEFCCRPHISYEVIARNSVRLKWNYTPKEIEQVFQHALIYRGKYIDLESTNTAILNGLVHEKEHQVMLKILDIDNDTVIESIDFKFYLASLAVPYAVNYEFSSTAIRSL